MNWIKVNNETHSPFDGSGEYKYICPYCHIAHDRMTRFCPDCGTRLTSGDEWDILEANIYDVQEIHSNCTVEVWKNSKTGDMSVGWYDPREA